jgi:hypothetical protein
VRRVTVSYVSKVLVRADDLLVDDDARQTWSRLSDDQRLAFVQWANKPWTNRGRRARQREATRALQLGGARSGLAESSVLDAILTSLPWGPGSS